MNQCRQLVSMALVALSLTCAQSVWGAEGSSESGSQVEPQSTYEPVEAGPSYQPAYQYPSGGSSENIIGYKPIPASALDGTITPTSAQTSSGLSAASPLAVATTRQSRAGAQSKLPPVYLTGILGDGPYTLGRDDVIHVEVRSQPEFSGDFIVNFDGRIQYNYVGDVPIAGLTKYEVQQVLERLIQKYVRVPIVNVSIVAYNSKVVYVIGEVNRPGKFVMRGDAIKLREAILAAGLPTHDAALSRIHVIKPDLNDPRIRVINMKRILYKGQLKDDVDLFPGEIVVVPSTVLSKVNDFLASLLSPVTRAASVAALAAL